ncbi:cytochrome P450 [Nocardia puris]|uniref:cytochrome P450 n=1 Tax=Nocardia puris TaxID=208602 RepID=UPI0018961895|nr:cytochrome P450 [Nocardia puris]MBF6212910.1 cytochrome P450 [Nocardia puris]MBF6367901.1 cytochrome P450 [Nocardia puris]MBF6463250.1 cytochrome P450 [Nocardia puris]
MKAPGPGLVETARLLPRLSRDALGTVGTLIDRYGDVVRVDAGPMLVYLVTDPSMTKYVLQDNYTNYRKSPIYDEFAILLGDGQLTTNNLEYWRKQRTLIHPAFSHSHVKQFAADITDSTATMLDRWDGAAGQYRDIYDDYVQLLLATTGRVLFGLDLTTGTRQVTDAMSAAFDFIMKRVNAPVKLPQHFPTPAARRVARKVGELDDVVRGLIEERRRGGDTADVLTALVRARDEGGQGMREEDLLNEIKTLLVAGHESPANALSWACYLLATHPDIQERLADEVRDRLGDRTPDFSDLAGLRYCRMVIEETMRLYPPAWIVERTPIEDDEIGGYHVPAGARVTLCMYYIHRDKRLWDDPEEFRPERFSDESVAERHKFAFFPFSGGPRICLGKDLSMTEMILMLAMTVQRFRLELDPDHEVVPAASVNLRPGTGIRIRPVRRAAAVVE